MPRKIRELVADLLAIHEDDWRLPQMGRIVSRRA